MRTTGFEPAGVAARDAFRTDIQALRGVAVLLVLLYHALPDVCRGGYLGVDVFFVVSGYLMTGILKREIEAGTFRFGAFYFRRAKRLLPAAYVCFAVTALLAVFFLTARERAEFARQLLGGVTFTANLVLREQIDYWSPAAHLKPLLHVWSLSVEEQFYLLLPAFLVVTPRALWRHALGAIVVASVVLSFHWARGDQAAAFYLLPARAWELALGGLGAFVAPGAERWLRRLFGPAVAALLGTSFLPVGTLPAGVDIVVMCVATWIVLLRRHPAAGRIAAVRGVATIGDISYSLYLVHWPLFAFAHNAWVTKPPRWLMLALFGLSFPLAIALYRAVERPLWKARLAPSRRTVGALVAASLVITALALAVPRVVRSEVDFVTLRRPNVGLGAVCDYGGEFVARPECRTTEAPEILVWGDSFAMMLVPGLVASGSQGVMQATKSVCGPFLGLAPLDDGNYRVGWAERCIRFNEAVLQHLEKVPSITTVVLSSPFSRFVPGEAWPDAARLLESNENSFEQRERSTEAAVAAMRRTAERVRALGKRVVVVAPPPSVRSFQTGECLERMAAGLPVFGEPGASSGCRVPIELFRSERSSVLELLRRLPGEAGVPVFSFESYLCDGVACAAELDGTPLYRDAWHLSYGGSEALGRSIGLADRLVALAR